MGHETEHIIQIPGTDRMTLHDEKTRELILLLASCPIEEFQQGRVRTSERPDDFVIFKMNKWVLTVGDIHKARTL